MKLKKLIKDIPIKAIKGNPNITITGICSNSKLVSPGNLFIARKGIAEEGSKYIPEAIASGAIAVLTDFFDPLLDKSITQIIHENVASIEACVAANYYEFASEQLFMVGITGTNGKTTTSFLVKHLLDNLFVSCGLIGTIKYIIGEQEYEATRTTPDAVSNQKMLREMVSKNCTSAVMEVTSHALDQHRVDVINFDTAVFTNLSHDHLDYHVTMDHYLKSKSKLFTSLEKLKIKSCHPFPKMAIINQDSLGYKEITQGSSAEILTYGIESDADIKALNIILKDTGTSFDISYKNEIVPFSWSLCGKFNVLNCLAAIGVGLSCHKPLKSIAKILEQANPVPGRLEKLANPLDLKLYIDFAHTDDALMNVLKCLQEFKKGRLITIFGCGGGRDITKRPKMAKVAQDYSDSVIVTSDNPRNEYPREIVNQIITGFSNKECYTIELDRRKAIELAINMASTEDCILIAGKGHEPYQIFAHKIIEFDDKKVALEICQEKVKTFKNLNEAL